MSNLSFWVDGQPLPKQSFRVTGKGRGMTDIRIKAWQATVGTSCLEACHSGPFRWEATPRNISLKVTMGFFRSNKHRCDLDNLSKAVLDAMQGIAYEDDTDVVKLELSKSYSKKRPGVTVLVEIL